MWTKLFLFLGVILCMTQVVPQEIYVAEVMVESNVTLSSASILASWSSGVVLTLNGSSLVINSSELVAECLVVGQDYSCNCSTGYAWSNEVCYNYGCCTPATCTQNVSLATSICVPITQVLINGSVLLTSSSWGTTATTKLTAGLTQLNGVGSTSVVQRGLYIADFWVNVSVRVDTTNLQRILTALQSNLTSAPIYADTKGIVNIYGPNDTVGYQTNTSLTCMLDEAMMDSGWNLSRPFARFSIANGLQANIFKDCSTADYPSCVRVNITGVTGAWAGIYECGFTTGTVRHTASTELKIALLPDVISMKFNPLVADCTGPIPTVTVGASIPNTTEKYTYFWTHNNDKTVQTDTNGQLTFNNTFLLKTCNDKNQLQKVNITFVNGKGQTKTESVDIPVLRDGQISCGKIVLPNEEWPKTPAGVTVFNTSCPPGRTGYKSRTCDLTGNWQDVFTSCISEQLSNVSNAATAFLNGLGATQDVALNIFEGMKNNSNSSSGSGDDVADISASIGIIAVMAKASENIVLTEDVFPNLVDAASNMVSSNWSGVNDSVRYSMSSNYLTNVESLVKNIQINTSEGFNTSNLELRFCSSADCSVSVFGIDVNLNKTNGTMKTMGVKNLMDKMKNGKFPGRNHSSIVLSATLVNNNDSNVTINMFFPDEQPDVTERLCVYWDTKSNDWSDQGCVANATDDNQTFCECNHLTSFSVLMAKSVNVSSPDLDIITYVGLGVSIFSLLVFLFVESLVWSAVTKSNLSHFRHTAVVNIAVFSLLANCSFLASAFPDKLSDTLCLTFTVCKHLFYLAMFTWMLCLSIMLVHQLIFVFSPVRKRVFMYLSSIVGYLLPIAIVGSSYVYYKYQQQEYYDKNTCWLIYTGLLVGSIHAFLLPVGTIILSNLFSMVVVIVTLVKTQVPDSSKANDKETAKSILKVVVFLSPVFGVTWIFGFGVLILKMGTLAHTIANYLFTILNSFQGLFILLTGVLGEQKVRQELMKVIMAKTGRETDSIKKLTNSSATLYTKDK